MKKAIVSIIGFGAIALGSTIAVAGFKSTAGQVTITNNPDGTRTVSGDLGFVRNTPDSVQHHGCFHRGDAGSSELVVCQSRTAAGTSVICSSSDARLIRVVDGLDSDSTLTYVIASTSTACNTIVVQTRSQTAPKVL
jgi:hypothetical protein